MRWMGEVAVGLMGLSGAKALKRQSRRDHRWRRMMLMVSNFGRSRPRDMPDDDPCRPPALRHPQTPTHAHHRRRHPSTMKPRPLHSR